MARRLLLGLVEGLVIGLVLGVASARALGLPAPGSLVALLLGSVTGFATGLVTGRPVWARDAKTEALLKAAAGALGGLGLTFALRRWLKVPVDLSAFSLGAGAAGRLVVFALPAVATMLALFFELDDDGARSAQLPRVSGGDRQRVEGSLSDAGPNDEEALDDEVDRKLEKR